MVENGRLSHAIRMTLSPTQNFVQLNKHYRLFYFIAPVSPTGRYYLHLAHTVQGSVSKGIPIRAIVAIISYFLNDIMLVEEGSTALLIDRSKFSRKCKKTHKDTKRDKEENKDVCCIFCIRARGPNRQSYRVPKGCQV